MNITWDEQCYESNFSFVHKYGEEVLDLIDVPSGSSVLDLGCGNGALTKALAERGYLTCGLDDSSQMIERARKAYPKLNFIKANAINFSLDFPVGAVFSNAVLHWIDKKNQPALIRSVARALVDGGQFVFECGGYGNTYEIHHALDLAFAKRGLTYITPQYYPTLAEYASMLEENGFLVTYATLFDRFTPLVGKDGVGDWIRLFVQEPFAGMEEALRNEIIQEASALTKPKLYIDGCWYADYVRLRMKAIKIGSH
jgi:trans-aconitate methyltransferase